MWVDAKAFFALISIKLIDDISISRDSSRPLPPSSSVTGPSTDDSHIGVGNATEKEQNFLEHKFLADSMVTQVGRWLRTIGVNVVVWNPDLRPKPLEAKTPRAPCWRTLPSRIGLS